MTTEENIPQKYYHAVFDATVAGITCLVSTTGYTGEDGVELYLKSEDAVAMWQALLENGKEEAYKALLTIKDVRMSNLKIANKRTNKEQMMDALFGPYLYNQKA